MNWDLNILCKSYDELDGLLQEVKHRALGFEKKYKGKLKKLSANEFYEAVREHEATLESISKGMSFVGLEFSVDSTKGAVMAKYQQIANDIQEKLLFFELEFNKIGEKKQKEFIKEGRGYSYYLTLLKKEKKHQLGLKEEKVLLKKEPVSASSFSRLFDEHLSRLKFKFLGKEVTEEEVLSSLYHEKREVRKEAQESLTKGLKPHLPLLGYVFNMIKTDTKLDCELRKYKNPEEARHIDNQTTQKSVDAMLSAVLESTNAVSDYYHIKAKLLGLKELQDYDRYAPLELKSREYDFETSKKLVLESFDNFNPTFADIAKRAFDEKWIDVFPRENKRGGAFSHGTVPSAHPYVMLNHTNRRRDAFTLAHELGHALHQYLSREVGYLNADTPLTTAETASVFAEMLLFDRLKTELPKEELVSLYAGKIEDMFATMYRQSIFTTFERRVHAHEGELSVEEFSRFWYEENQKMFGDSVKLTKNYEIWWSYIPHFIHSPFYCYAYAYGQLLTLALFGLYKQGMSDFKERYTHFLKSGGSKSPKELVELFGFDINSKAFWKIGLGECQKIVDEFKGLIDGK